MLPTVVPEDPELRCAFDAVHIFDGRDMDRSLGGQLPRDISAHVYRLRDRTLHTARFTTPITGMSRRRFGALYGSHMADRFGVDIDIGGAGLDRFCFGWMLTGHMALARDGAEVAAGPGLGFIYRGEPGTRLMTEDGNERQNLWIEAADLHRTLENLLGDRVRRPVVFSPAVLLDRGAGGSVFAQLRFLVDELKRPRGPADNPIAVASYTDLVLRLVLGALPNNYTQRLAAVPGTAVPFYVRRAEDFMVAHAASPLRIEDVARVAGCAVRTLNEGFRRFRDTTPLAALHAIRLEGVRAALQRGHAEKSLGEIARSYGFTHPGRFGQAYRRRFREAPAETRRIYGQPDISDPR